MIADWLLPPNLRFFARALAGRERRTSRMRFLREVVNWTVPPRLQDVVLGLGYRFGGVDVRNNRSLAGRHPGRRIFVIGNGPSLAGMDLKPLAGELTIGANSFYKHPDAEAVGLDYLCIGDRSFMIDEPRSIEWHRTIEHKLPGAVLMLHPDARAIIEAHGLYRGHEVHYFRRGVVVQHPELIHFDFTRPINVGNTTGTQLAIPLAVCLGATEIVLLGFDANWLESFTGSYHFYATHDQFPEFDSLKSDDRWDRYEDHLVFALRDFEAHRLLATRAAQLGIRIVNATRGGLLDMYPRVRFEDCIDRRSGR
jgi:hypothetical protein